MPDTFSNRDTENEIFHLWKKYYKNKTNDCKNELITYYLKPTKIIAATLYAKRFNNQVDFSDYYHYGIIGLIDSIERFDISRQIQFMSYAKFRIKGSILNGISKMSDHMDRAQSLNNISKYDERVEILKESKEEDGSNLFNEMIDLSINLAFGSLLSIEMSDTNNFNYGNPEYLNFKDTLDYYVSCLEKDEQTIITYHYFYDIPFKSIADILGVSKSRVAQVHKHSLLKIRQLFESTLDVNI